MPAKDLHPALQYLKDNAVVIGILVILAVSIGTYAMSQASASTPRSAPVPVAPEVTAVPLETVAPATSSAPSLGTETIPTTAPTTTGNPARGAAPVVGQASGATAGPEIVAGGAQQAVKAQDWRPPVEAFSAAWANPDGGKDAWMDRLKPYATPALAATFAYTDISSVPTDKLSSISTINEASGTVSFKAYYEDGGLRFQGLAIIRPDGSWVVDKVSAPEKK